MTSKGSAKPAICGARKKDGTPCRGRPMANGRCRLHGGKSPAGVASGQFKHGIYSKYMPKGMLDLYEEFRTNPDLLSLRENVALVDARIVQLLQALDQQGDLGAIWLELQQLFETLMRATQKQDLGGGKAAFEALGDVIEHGADQFRAWSQISEMMEQRRKLVETERRRLVDMQQMITSEQAMVLVSALVTIIREEVTDRDVLIRLQSRIAGLVVQRHSARLDPGDSEP